MFLGVLSLCLEIDSMLICVDFRLIGILLMVCMVLVWKRVLVFLVSLVSFMIGKIVLVLLFVYMMEMMVVFGDSVVL